MNDRQGASSSRVETASSLRKLTERLAVADRIAFDTEFVSESTFEPVLCLIQVATSDLTATIDPLAIDDLTPFWNVLLDPAIEIVMHAAGEDTRIIRRKTGEIPRRLFDVQIAAGLIGLGYPLSHGSLVSQLLGVTVHGGETRTDWRKRPLSDGQLRYALDDVRYLLKATDLLKDRLVELDRIAWAEAEMDAFLDEIRRKGDDDERWRRLPGLHQLNRIGLECAKRLSEWRIDEARRTNRPVKQVLRDDLLIAIAKRRPQGRKDLEALRDFNRPHLLRTAGSILETIERAGEIPVDELPEHAERFDDRPGWSMLVSLLSATLARCCVENKTAPALTGSANDIRDLIRRYVEGEIEASPPYLMRGWRGEVCGKTLLDVLSGRDGVRVGDLGAEVPVVIETIVRK